MPWKRKTHDLFVLVHRFSSFLLDEIICNQNQKVKINSKIFIASLFLLTICRVHGMRKGAGENTCRNDIVV